MYDDEDEDRDQALQKLSGDVDDFAGSKLKDPDGDNGRFGKGPDAGGTTVTISVTPYAQPGKKDGPEDEENAGGIDKETDKEQEEDEPHDPIAHILGMCGGGCAR